MNSLSEVMGSLQALGNPQTIKVLSRHGAPVDSMFGVKIGDLKPIQKKIKGNQKLAMQLYATGNSDAMYLAGLVADGRLMKKTELKSWAKNASWYLIAEYTVPAVTAESQFAVELANEWICSGNPHFHSIGWATWSLIVATFDDSELDLAALKLLLKRVETEIHASENRTRYCMNGFVISVGGYVQPLTKHAKSTAKKIGRVEIDSGDTSCKVPVALDYINRMEAKGVIGKKRRSTKC